MGGVSTLNQLARIHFSPTSGNGMEEVAVAFLSGSANSDHFPPVTIFNPKFFFRLGPILTDHSPEAATPIHPSPLALGPSIPEWRVIRPRYNFPLWQHLKNPTTLPRTNHELLTTLQVETRAQIPGLRDTESYYHQRAGISGIYWYCSPWRTACRGEIAVVTLFSRHWLSR